MIDRMFVHNPAKPGTMLDCNGLKAHQLRTLAEGVHQAVLVQLKDAGVALDSLHVISVKLDVCATLAVAPHIPFGPGSDLSGTEETKETPDEPSDGSGETAPG